MSLPLAALALAQTIDVTVMVNPGAIEEPCVSLDRGDRLEYLFKASAPLDFNLHYHEDKVYFPIDLRAVATAEGQYVAPEARTYCLMWTNKQADAVEIDYQYRVYSEEPQ